MRETVNDISYLSDTILKANDDVSLTMNQYKKIVEGVTENGQPGNARGKTIILSLMNLSGVYCLRH
jgi:hypothetical protein